MKKLFCILLLLTATIISFAQDFSIDIKFISDELSRVYETSANQASVKHILAKEWVAKTFGDYKSVLQFEDDNACKIIVKGFSPMSDDSKLSYTITIDSRDDKYRVVISDLEIRDYVLQVSRILKSNAEETRLLEEVGLNDQSFIDMKFSDYVSINDDIADNLQIVRDSEVLLERISARIKDLEANGNTYDYSKKPKGMTKTLYRQRVNRGEYGGANLDQLNDSIDIVNHRIERAYLENEEYKQRVIDVENSLGGILKSLYKTMNAKDDF